MPAFAVISACSLVHGKLCYEGKLVAAILEAKLGVALDYVWDDKTGDAAGITVTGTLPDGRVRSITGTVADWKTSGTGSPWGTPIKNRKMLANRGTREWARLWAPGVLLGIYTNDELEDLQEAARDTRRARMTPPTPTLPGPATAVIEHEAQPSDVDLKGNTDAPCENKAADQQPAAAQDQVKKTPPKPDATKPAETAPPKKAPPIPPANKAKAQPQQEQPKPEDADQTDWEAEIEAFDNVCSSAESAEEIDEAKQAHEHLFALTTPKAVGERVDKIIAGELERIGRQG